MGGVDRREGKRKKREKERKRKGRKINKKRKGYLGEEEGANAIFLWEKSHKVSFFFLFFLL